MSFQVVESVLSADKNSQTKKPTVDFLLSFVHSMHESTVKRNGRPVEGSKKRLEPERSAIWFKQRGLDRTRKRLSNPQIPAEPYIFAKHSGLSKVINSAVVQMKSKQAGVNKLSAMAALEVPFIGNSEACI